jgi:hypothetical protein
MGCGEGTMVKDAFFGRICVGCPGLANFGYNSTCATVAAFRSFVEDIRIALRRSRDSFVKLGRWRAGTPRECAAVLSPRTKVSQRTRGGTTGQVRIETSGGRRHTKVGKPISGLPLVDPANDAAALTGCAMVAGQARGRVTDWPVAIVQWLETPRRQDCVPVDPPMPRGRKPVPRVPGMAGTVSLGVFTWRIQVPERTPPVRPREQM